MTLRIATVADIPAMQVIRLAVTENRLSDPRKVTDEHCREMLEERGWGWVVERAGQIEGFGMADAVARSIWALFVKPGCEGRGPRTRPDNRSGHRRSERASRNRQSAMNGRSGAPHRRVTDRPVRKLTGAAVHWPPFCFSRNGAL